MARAKKTVVRKRTVKKSTGVKAKEKTNFVLPTVRSKPVDNIWNYSYHITGTKKIGKTSFLIDGCEEFILQCDRPSLSKSVMEVMPKNWKELKGWVTALEKAAVESSFPYERIILDGVADSYIMCEIWVLNEFDLESMNDKYSTGFREQKKEFGSLMNRLLRLGISANCGVAFTSHSTWVEKKVRGKTVNKLTNNLPGKADDLVAGKVDANFVFDYVGDKRVLFLQGDDELVADHSIDGHFLTTDGREIKEIYMGTNPHEAMQTFEKAFNNQLDYTTLDEYENNRKKKNRGAKKVSKRAAKKTAKRRK